MPAGALFRPVAGFFVSLRGEGRWYPACCPPPHRPPPIHTPVGGEQLPPACRLRPCCPDGGEGGGALPPRPGATLVLERVFCDRRNKLPPPQPPPPYPNSLNVMLVCVAVTFVFSPLAFSLPILTHSSITILPAHFPSISIWLGLALRDRALCCFLCVPYMPPVLLLGTTRDY